MLGEKIGEGTGKMLGTRVVAEGGMHKVEVSEQENGKLLGVDCTQMVTYLSTMRPGGTPFGEGRGVLMSREGETATFVGNGVGRTTGKGMAMQWRGTLFYQTTSSKLARLNGMAVNFEHDIDEQGNSQTRYWEWK
jgi:hypothetical protein